MSLRTPALRGSLFAVCASLALQSFAAENHSSTASLDPTVVTAGRIQQNLNDVIADMTVVVAKEFHLLLLHRLHLLMI